MIRLYDPKMSLEMQCSIASNDGYCLSVSNSLARLLSIIIVPLVPEVAIVVGMDDTIGSVGSSVLPRHSTIWFRLA